MLWVDIGDDCDRGGQTVKGAVALVRLDDHPLALAHARVGPIGVNDAAIDNRRVKAAFVQQGGNHGGRRGLAVRACDGHVGFQAHQLGQHLGPAHDRQFLRPRGVQLRIARLDGRGNDDDLGPF